jgi:NTE family protein
MAETLEQRALVHGADLVLEGGGVKGIGLAGAIIALDDAGYVFPRVAGTSAGAIVSSLVAAYQTRGIPVSQLRADMDELDYNRFKVANWVEKHLGKAGLAYTLVKKQGMYATTYLSEWLHSKLDPLDVRTFADLKITDDPNTSLPPEQRYRLVVHTSDLTRQALVRLPWDLPYYSLADADNATLEQKIAAIDAYPIVDAVRASMSIPFFFQPFRQKTPEGECTWVDGGMLQNFPVTVFDRTDGKLPRWPTWGVKLSARPPIDVPEKAVKGDVAELLAIAHTALGEWDRYPLLSEGVSSRTVFVDTMHVSATDFGLSAQLRQQLFENGTAAAQQFLQAWNAAQAALTTLPATEVLTPPPAVAPAGGQS